jgi:hypothetical protein
VDTLTWQQEELVNRVHHKSVEDVINNVVVSVGIYLDQESIDLRILNHCKVFKHNYNDIASFSIHNDSEWYKKLEFFIPKDGNGIALEEYVVLDDENITEDLKSILIGFLKSLPEQED